MNYNWTQKSLTFYGFILLHFDHRGTINLVLRIYQIFWAINFMILIILIKNEIKKKDIKFNWDLFVKRVNLNIKNGKCK